MIPSTSAKLTVVSNASGDLPCLLTLLLEGTSSTPGWGVHMLSISLRPREGVSIHYPHESPNLRHISHRPLFVGENDPGSSRRTMIARESLFRSVALRKNTLRSIQPAHPGSATLCLLQWRSLLRWPESGLRSCREGSTGVTHIASIGDVIRQNGAGVKHPSSSASLEEENARYVGRQVRLEIRCGRPWWGRWSPQWW